MTQQQRMSANLPYQSSDESLTAQRLSAQNICYQINQLAPHQLEQRKELFRSLLGKVGSNFYIEQPFRCDYGWNIHIGEDFYCNYNCTILDCGKVTIGDRVMFAPNVSIYTAGHPLHPVMRASGYEYGMDIQIGNDVWIGGNTVINPGVSIGDGVVIGSGSVVTKDIPPYVVATGNPCRVIRPITEQDKQYYFQKRLFETQILEEFL